MKLNKILKEAQKVQAKLAKIQEELAERTVEASSGGGMVTVVVNGKMELVDIKIEKDIVNPDDIEMLQDLILAAVNEGLRKAKEMVQEEMAKATMGFNIPGLV